MISIRPSAPAALALALALALSVAIAVAQPADEPTSAPQQAAEAPDPQSASGEISGQPNAPRESGGSDDSPFDYQATEKISEDLSVSFPVDI